MSRPWNDIDPEEEKLLGQWNQDTAFSHQSCLSPEMIRAFLEECLPEPELASARRHLEACPVCTALANDLKTLEVAGPTPLEVRRMRARIGLPAEPVAEEKVRRAWWLKFAPWVLAAACGAVAIGVWSRTDQPPRTVAGNAPPIIDGTKKADPVGRQIPVRPAAVRMPLGSLVWRGEDKTADAYPAMLAKALEPYRANRYEEAIAALQGVVEKSPRRAEGQFYLGVSLLLAGRAGDAVDPLQKAMAAGESAVSGEVKWYLAVALHNVGRVNEAAPMLQSVCSGAGEHQKEACAAIGGR
jgi:tetratricopeptide (TPR) repeat protein